LPTEFKYANAGVDRELRTKSKKALRLLDETFRFSRYGEVVQLPYENIFPVGENRYLDFVIETVGSKVLVAQLAGKYDTIAIDGIAMAVNDVIRSGAKPLALADNIHEQISDAALMEEWMKGIVRGATESECIVPSGEVGELPEVIKGLTEGKGFDMVFSALGEVTRERIIWGKSLKEGDVIVGLRSSGVHSNGVSLARKVLFKQWGGKYRAEQIPDGLDREIVSEVLEPTRIYVKPLLAVTDPVEVKAAVHITGDAYLKFDRLTKFSGDIGFEFEKFDPQPIFELIQETGAELGRRISDEEMFKTFNMGWGFAVIVDRKEVDETLDILGKTGVQAEQVGRVTEQRGTRITFRNRKIVFT
jgi:phosphoribosylformylglycinamidine cyclo-ligase